ncbi:bifunctional phosphatase PAP2/diacylglycerol kinase family protein [Streptomyces sp. MUSC 14]|uniref:bifunctional phosphatase PAP2/diacylglycerol kinase family protein n=1 Tax=Streptomyces sp. MUSC 14 TaxID=1354889 RepID=UPI0009A0F8C3|nr:phosphatase PAP2 family protein [Streptomyces sp. MUSC 14]
MASRPQYTARTLLTLLTRPPAARGRASSSPGPVRTLLARADRRVFEEVAARHWILAEKVLPRLSRSADHGLLWFGVAAGMGTLGGRTRRRAAARAVASLAVASATVNTLVKRSARRARPPLDRVPAVRHLARLPFTTSFPSGHAASAAAFAFGAGLESRRWGLALAPLAWSVAFSRVYTGVHYPGDVLAGAALGVGAAYAVRGIAPTREQLGPQARPHAEAPALPAGRGLVVVANGAAGTGGEALRQARAALPEAEFVTAKPGDSLEELFDQAAGRATALGVIGGDGTVNAAVAAAVRRGLPLAVLPGGTLNHFAYDLDLHSVGATAEAVVGGHAVSVDVARFRPGPDGREAYFVNTFSIGAYTDLVRIREEWSPRLGSVAAGTLAVLRVLRTARPVKAEFDGHERQMWLLFIGNCTYRGLGLAPVRRHDLADGLLDVRVVRAGHLARLRLVAAALSGALRRSPVLSARRVERLRVTGLDGATHVAYDGETAPAPPALLLDKAPTPLTVYRPLPQVP